MKQPPAKPPTVEQRHKRRSKSNNKAERLAPAPPSIPVTRQPYKPPVYGDDGMPMFDYASATGIEEGNPTEFEKAWLEYEKRIDRAYDQELDSMGFERKPSQVGHNRGPSLHPTRRTKEKVEQFRFAATWRAIVFGIRGAVHYFANRDVLIRESRYLPEGDYYLVGPKNPRISRNWRWLMHKTVGLFVHDGAVEPSSVAPSCMDGRPRSKEKFMKQLKS
jgi:hypothetical protein